MPFGNCQAQETVALEISPLKNFYSLEPGQNQTGQLFLKNLSSISLKVKPRIVSFTTIDDQGTLQINEGDFSQFVRVPISVLELAPGQKRQVTYEISAPQNELGGKYFAILFATEPKEEQGTLLSGEVGSLVFLEILGELKNEVKIKDFNVEEKINWNAPQFTGTISNIGNTHATPFGEIKIYNWRGKEKDSIQIYYPTILPGKERKLEFESQKSLFGKYSAKLNIIGDDWDLISSEVEFWVLPKIALTLIIIFLIIFIVLIIFLIREPLKNRGS